MSTTLLKPTAEYHRQDPLKDDHIIREW